MHVIIEIAISMVGLYIIFSIVNSALVEGYAQLINKRGTHLKDSLDNFFQDPADATINLADDLYNHKLIRAFMEKKNVKPAYIDAKIFTQAFMELVFEDTHSKDTRFTGTTKKDIQHKLPGDLDKTLNFIINKATEKEGINMEKVQDEIGSLYESYMKRVSEWYKKKMKYLLTVTGLILAFSLNLDSINFFTALKSDDDLREEQVAIAKQLYENQTEIQAKADSLKSSMDFTNADPEHLKAGVNDLISQILDEKGAKSLEDNFTELNIGIHQFMKGKNSIADYLWGILGIGLTGFALSFGSTFWFGLLKKLLSK